MSDIADIKDTKARAKLDRLALKIGRALILFHEQAHTIDEALAIATKFLPLS